MDIEILDKNDVKYQNKKARIIIRGDRCGPRSDSKQSSQKRLITARRGSDIIDEELQGILKNLTIIGGGRAKKKLLTMIEKYRSRVAIYREKGIEPRVGLIIYGLFGVGKSKLVKEFIKAYMKKYSNVDYIEIKPKEYLTKRIKGVEIIEKTCGKAISRIRETGNTVIIFIDECEALFPRRGNNRETGIIAPERTNVLLKIIDDIIDDPEIVGKLFFIGTTNLIWKVDPGIIRSGRFDRVSILLPNLKERLGLTRLYLGKLDIEIEIPRIGGGREKVIYNILDIINEDEVVELTEGFSGADFMTLGREMFDMMLDKKEKGICVEIRDITKVIYEHSLSITNSAMNEIREFEESMRKIDEGSGVDTEMFEPDVFEDIGE